MAKRKAASAVLGKVAARFVPGLGLLLLLNDLYQWWQQTNVPTPLGEKCNASIAACDGGFWFFDAGSIGASCTPKCSGTVTVSPGNPQFTTTGTGWVREFHKVTGFTNRRVLFTERQYAPGTVVRIGPLPTFGPGRSPKAWDEPVYQPWFDPSLPPQFQPSAKREPMPDHIPRFPYNDPWRYPRPTNDPIISPSQDPADPGHWEYPWRKPRTRRRPPRTTRPRPWPKPRVRRPAPGLDPMPRPVMPVPYPVTDPPIVAPSPNPGPGVRPAPGEAPTPAPVPGYQQPPGWQVVIPAPRLGVVPRLREQEPGPPGNRPVTPPRPRERETKLGANRAGLGWMLWVFNFATEADDFLGAIAKALPCAIQKKLPRDTNIPAMLDVLYNNWDKIDWNAAMSELFLNQVEDYIIGRSRAAVSKGFGTEKNWYNYWKMLQAEDLTEFGSATGKTVNGVLDLLAEKAGLHRVNCRKR